MYLSSEKCFPFLFGLRVADSGDRSQYTIRGTIVHCAGVTPIRICTVGSVARRGTLRVISACTCESVPKCLDIKEAEDACLKGLFEGDVRRFSKR